MPYPHSIRLRRLWELELAAAPPRHAAQPHGGSTPGGNPPDTPLEIAMPQEPAPTRAAPHGAALPAAQLWPPQAPAAERPAREPSGQQIRVDVPGVWEVPVPPGWQGSVRLRRRFHRPATLEQHERVFLVVAGAEPSGGLSVNGVHLGPLPQGTKEAEFEITALLAERNEILIELAASQARQQAMHQLTVRLGEVRLEIRGDG